MAPWRLSFAPGTTELDPQARANLAQILDFTRSNEVAEILLVGVTEDTGNQERNRLLGRMVADLARDALVTADTQGALDMTLLRVVGPRAADGAARRVEIWVRR